MIEKYVSDIATQMEIELSEVSLTDGSTLGCKDVHLLDICSADKSVSTLVFYSDLMELENNLDCSRLEVKIRTALSRLKSQDTVQGVDDHF